MSKSSAKSDILLMDANILIDFIKADRTILTLIIRHVGQIYVIRSVVEEVNEITESELEQLSIVVVEEEIEDAYQVIQKDSLSFQDQLCLLTAKRFGYICATNEKRLLKRCSEEKIPTVRGLRILLNLHKKAGIGKAEAIKIAEKIHEENPKHIHRGLVDEFIKKINE